MNDRTSEDAADAAEPVPVEDEAGTAATDIGEASTPPVDAAPPAVLPERRERRRGDRRRTPFVYRFAGEAPTPESTQLRGPSLSGATGVIAAALVGLLLLGIVYTLYFARPLLIPFTAAILLGFLLKPVIRLLRNLGIPEMLGTITVFLAFIGTVGLSVYLLAPAAAEWLSRLPENAEQAEERLRDIIERLGAVREAVDEAARVSPAEGAGAAQPDVVRVAPEPLSARILSGAQSFVVGTAAAVFLLFLLLASGETFLRRTVAMLPTLDHRKRLVRITHDIERDLSVYLITTSIINAGLGIAVGFALYLIGVPNAVLWAVVVAVLNFIPYLGGLAGVVMIGLVAIASIDDLGRALMAPAAYLVLNGIEAYVVTPHILGARFSLNPVAVFVAVFFWGWIWGIPGALLAVPILTALSIVFANIDALKPIAVFLKA